MATPRPAAQPGGEGWNGSIQATCAPAFSAAPEPGSESGAQVRPMSLKIHYTFDREARVNCLARHSHTLHVQTVPIDETIAIGIVDLRACLHAVIECSPELATQDADYAIYAVDYSELDTPLVGQGMLSRALESMRNDAMPQPPKLVTGRVTKNLLAVFGGGNRETLEVKLKFSESAKVRRHVCNGSADLQSTRPVDQQFADRPVDSPMTPTGTSEWNSFMQANPQIGQGGQISRVASPAFSQGPAPPTNDLQLYGQRIAPQAMPHAAQEVHRVAPTPVESSEQVRASVPTRPSSQASSRASRRKKTGRPRGRPRKKPADGNTSGYEEATEGEDGPAKKRAKTTRADRSSLNPFAAGPESLRVAASTSGSLRNFRPVGASSEGTSGSHLQEMPRAPTPIPGGGSFAGLPGRGLGQPNLRQESGLGPHHQAIAAYSDSRLQPLSPGQEDCRSPESLAPTPAYSEDSMASSPPVQRTAPFMRSSPPPSSPILPPMPSTEAPSQGSGFPNDEMDDLFGEESLHPNPGQNAMPTRAPPGKPTESKARTTAVPIQVFQMQDGPMGQDMVHICTYNGASHAPSAPPPAHPRAFSEAPSLPPLKNAPRPRQRRAPAAKKSRAAPNPLPAMEPTPPPTTDGAERCASPAPMAETPCTEGQPSPAPVSETMQGVLQSEESNDSPAVSRSDTSSGGEMAMQQDSRSAARPKRSALQSARAKDVRPLVRSQSAGAMSLALPSVPASKSPGPSSLSQCISAEPSAPNPPGVHGLRRAASSGPLALPVPESDPVGPAASMQQQMPPQEPPKVPSPPMDAPPPASSPPPVKSNKNRVKKFAIKQRLEEAIMNGEMPPFCRNCGAIETPTWRKIWVQEHEGKPQYCEYSEKPGKVTAIEIIKRDADENPTSYRLIKKSLGPAEDKETWQELLLCNPCGIWLTKCKCHRPPDRWDKDFSRIGQERRRKGTGGGTSRSRKPRAKTEAQVNPTSDAAYLLTDALGPVEPSSPKAASVARLVRASSQAGEARVPSAGESGGGGGDEIRSNPGSTHSRGSGTVNSPVELDFDEAVGGTKRLLFPSPRKDGSLKVLGEVKVNLVQTADDSQLFKRLVGDKENSAVSDGNEASKELGSLAKAPVAARLSTSPPKAKDAASTRFKTPTRNTPSHRPITRSVSRSLRSIRSIASPGQALLQQTPTKTPRLGNGSSGSAGRRRSPRKHQGAFEMFDAPISRSFSQVFSDPASFNLGDEFDLGSLPALDANGSDLMDFGSLLSTDALMPSSPPGDGYDYGNSANLWAPWTMDAPDGMQE